MKALKNITFRELKEVLLKCIANRQTWFVSSVTTRVSNRLSCKTQVTELYLVALAVAQFMMLTLHTG